jgi:hypothetical protein
MSNKLEGIWKERSWYNWRNNPGIFLKTIRQIKKKEAIRISKFEPEISGTQISNISV